jgi:hypothetical protein
MRSQRSVLTLKYTPVSIAGGVRKAVGGFLRYVQYRDQHFEPAADRGLDAYVRYVAHRDRTSPRGRIFGRDGACTDAERRQLVAFVARSVRGLEPRWVIGKDGQRQDRQRAVYTFILSPEDWRGLDLRRLAQVAMRQLESAAGPAGIGPWFAAEHRNTAHHHVHIVLAARRETAPGRFSALLITRARLQQMKDAIALEIDRQRGREIAPSLNAAALPKQPATPSPRPRGQRPSKCHLRWLSPHQSNLIQRRRMSKRPRWISRAGGTVVRLQAVARRYAERIERELESEDARAGREGWIR